MVRVKGTLTRVEQGTFQMSEEDLLSSVDQLDPVNVLEQIKKKFCKACTGWRDAFIHGNNWYIYEDYGNHYSTDEEIRPATEEEKSFFKGLKGLIAQYNIAVTSATQPKEKTE